MRKIVAKITLTNQIAIIQSHPESIDYLSNFFTVMDTSKCWQRNTFVKELAVPVCFITKAQADPTGAMIPIGLISTLEKILKKLNAIYKITDSRIKEEFNFTDDDIKNCINEKELRYYQVDALKAMFQNKNGTIKAGTGAGKCLAKNTPVLMFDGSIKEVQDIKIGDKIMGPDSKPRNILSTTTGKEMMYDVIPVKGEKYTVNESHILSLKLTSSDRYWYRADKNGIINISVKDYLKESKKFKHYTKGYRVPIDFSEQQLPSHVDPYFLGLWLGDGKSRYTSIINIDEEVIQYLRDYANQINMRLREEPINDLSYSFTSLGGRKDAGRGKHSNVMFNQMRELGVIKNKHIPQIYKTNNRENRLKLLAGLLDSDGSLDKNNVFDFISINRKLAEDVVFIARSVGLAAYLKKSKKIATNGKMKEHGLYFRVQISGNIDIIPTKIKRKRARSRKQIKNVLVTGITVKEVGIGDYYGFEIDGDRRFVLGDFTVTHNTTIFTAWTKLTKKKTLILFKEIKLAHQTMDEMRLAGVDAGIIQGNNIEENHQVVMCTVQSSHKITRNDYEAVICDESHNASQDRYQNILKKDFAYRFGFSATPFNPKNKLKTYKVKAWIGDIIYDKPAKELIDEGYLAKPLIVFYRIKKVIKDIKRSGKIVEQEVEIFDQQWAGAERNGIVLNKYRNKVIKLLANNLSGTVLVLTKYVESHGMKLHKEISDALYLSGKNKLEERKQAVKMLENNEIKVIIASTIFDEGISLNNVSNVLLVSSGKSYEKSLQRVGRGMRLNYDKDGNIIKNTVRIFDFYDETHPILERHAKERIKYFEDEGYEVVIKDLPS